MHQKETENDRYTLCSAFHAPFRCPRVQCNGESGKPNWARVENKRAKQESRGLIFDGEQMQLNLQLIFHQSSLNSI